MKQIGDPKILSETCDRLRTLRAEDRPLWGTMSAAQMVRHLRLAYEIALGEGAAVCPRGLAPRILKFFALKTSVRWPRNVQTLPSLKRAVEQMDPVESIAEDVEATIARMEQLASASRCAPNHGIFGPMQTRDWMRWGYLHADHHLRQFGR